jgi:hypothetical protein
MEEQEKLERQIRADADLQIQKLNADADLLLSLANRFEQDAFFIDGRLGRRDEVSFLWYCKGNAMGSHRCGAVHQARQL